MWGGHFVIHHDQDLSESDLKSLHFELDSRIANQNIQQALSVCMDVITFLQALSIHITVSTRLVVPEQTAVVHTVADVNMSDCSECVSAK
jgi:hypothetical protein